MKHLKVAVVIPVYNGEKTLKQCLDSVLNQTYENYEVIVVDNNSTDRTKEIIKDFQNKNKKIRYVFESYISRGAARNKGEKIANGEIILMTDSDCIVPKNWIKEMIEPILNDEYDAVQGFEDEDINNTFWSKQEGLKMKLLEKIKIVNADEVLGKIDTKNFAIFSDSLKKIGFTNRKYLSGNDTDLSIQLRKNNFKLKFLNHVRVKHSHPNSFKKIVKTYYCRAFWCAVITKDYKDYLKNTSFLKDTNQTLWSFTKFFPGLIKTIILHGHKWAYFDFITGLTWRIGLVKGWLKR